MSDIEDDETNEGGELTPKIIDAYKSAAAIANNVLATVVAAVTPGKKIVDLCALGDKLITDQTGAVYNKEKVEKGIAFPTCVSVNNCAGHFSPLLNDTTVIAEGDLVKVDLGVHIDGYVSVIAHTLVASSAPPSAPTTGRKADVICAAHYAAECVHRLIKPGKKNTEVTDVIQKVADAYKTQPVEGVLSHQTKRFVIDGNNVILNKVALEQKVDEFEFEENQVYGVDVVVSSGDGKVRELEARTTVYKRAVEAQYQLKTKAARQVLNEVNAKFPTFPFSLRGLEDEKQARLGIVECVRHDLMHPYPTLFEKPGEFVAQFKYTVLVLPSSTLRLNAHPLPFVASDYKIEDPAILAILAQGTKRSKKSKSKKKKTSNAAATPADDAAAPMET
eukprot:TRINITY_DN11860_c1_g1_i1.p1 TRINITY_DN11860_c1_g1~~TRINITY_DN11860_c1_g1_i1.p1  ORF type:complete len:406 (+),score=147.45 TRINITY_DN11860_c1_g1_i1:49-1218(+)